MNATFTKDSRVDMEKLFLLRLHNGGKVSGVDALDPVGREKCLGPGEGLGGSKDHLLKLLEIRQAREQLHKAQHFWVLELVVVQTAGRPRPNPSGRGMGARKPQVVGDSLMK